MKKCSVCTVEKKFADFYPDKRSKIGLSSSCIACERARYKKNAHVFKLRNASKTESQREAARIRDRHRALSEKRKNSKNTAYKKWFNQEKNKIKIFAQRQVHKAIKAGELVPQNCQICGSSNRVHAHHEAYERPLNVTWLCPKHHKARHKQLDVMI